MIFSHIYKVLISVGIPTYFKMYCHSMLPETVLNHYAQTNLYGPMENALKIQTAIHWSNQWFEVLTGKLPIAFARPPNTSRPRLFGPAVDTSGDRAQSVTGAGAAAMIATSAPVNTSVLLPRTISHTHEVVLRTEVAENAVPCTPMSNPVIDTSPENSAIALKVLHEAFGRREGRVGWRSEIQQAGIYLMQRMMNQAGQYLLVSSTGSGKSLLFEAAVLLSSLKAAGGASGRVVHVVVVPLIALGYNMVESIEKTHPDMSVAFYHGSDLAVTADEIHTFDLVFISPEAGLQLAKSLQTLSMTNRLGVRSLQTALTYSTTKLIQGVCLHDYCFLLIM